MNITITPHNPIKDFFYKIASKIEDCIFTLFERLPDRLIPAFVLNWMERYTDRRLAKLKVAFRLRMLTGERFSVTAC